MRPKILSLTLDPELYLAVRETARRLRITPASFIRAVVAATLWEAQTERQRSDEDEKAEVKR